MRTCLIWFCVIICNRELTLLLNERTPKSIQDVTDLADHYREAGLTNASTLASVNHSEFRSPKVNNKFQPKTSLISKSEIKCYQCHKFGHIAPDCSNNPKASSFASQQFSKGFNEKSDAKSVSSLRFLQILQLTVWQVKLQSSKISKLCLFQLVLSRVSLLLS